METKSIIVGTVFVLGYYFYHEIPAKPDTHKKQVFPILNTGSKSQYNITIQNTTDKPDFSCEAQLATIGRLKS
ncbi:MAG: hypothetical protein E6H07_16900 [Bacteroidetes bacterium]|nr:MAG: hypothetical protein E6H07_16900 [Bacteroidota bacterium]